MILEIDKSTPVFIGKKGSIGTIPSGTYQVYVILPPTEGKDLTWYQIANTQNTIGFNPKNLPKGVILREG